MEYIEYVNKVTEELKEVLLDVKKGRDWRRRISFYSTNGYSF